MLNGTHKWGLSWNHTQLRMLQLLSHKVLPICKLFASVFSSHVWVFWAFSAHFCSVSAPALERNAWLSKSSPHRWYRQHARQEVPSPGFSQSTHAMPQWELLLHVLRLRPWNERPRRPVCSAVFSNVATQKYPSRHSHHHDRQKDLIVKLKTIARLVL